jgi:hypothetical protein
MTSPDRRVLALAFPLALSACAGGPAAPPGFEARSFAPVTSSGEFVDLVADRPIAFPNGAELVARPDGTLAGTAGGQPVAGTWSFEGGRLCRQMTIGAAAQPEICNALEIGEETVRLLNPDGSLLSEAALGAGG